MILPLFDQSKLYDELGNVSLTPEAEAIRLSNELRAKPEQVISVNIFHPEWNVIIPAKSGFDCETADYLDFTNWLNSNVKKSESLFWFVVRIMAWRFTDKHSDIKNSLSLRRQLEFEFILSEMKKDIFWTGRVGFSNMVRLDGSLTNPKNMAVKNRNETFKIVRK